MALNSYTFASLKTAVKAALGRDAHANTSNGEIVNNALTYLAECHPWTWLHRNLLLDFTATAITTLERASNVVTLTDTAHGLQVGDVIRVTGSVATDDTFNGTHVVASVPTADTLTFAQTGEDETATTPGSWIPSFIALPADFKAFLGQPHRTTQWGDLLAATTDEIAKFRRLTTAVASHSSMYYALSFSPQASVTALPTYRIEVYPAPSSSLSAAITGKYLRVLPKMTDDTHVPDIPATFHVLLHRLVRAKAISDEHNESSEDWRLFDKMLPKYIESDEGGQDNLGDICGTVSESQNQYGPFAFRRINFA